MERIDLDWNELPPFSGFEPSGAFLDYFSGYGQSGLEETVKVSGFLSHLISQYNLDAITVECFPLVKEHQVTACRTRIEVRLTREAVQQLREDPLGNHHLIFPGDCTGLLRMACWLIYF